MGCQYCITKKLQNMKISDISYNPKVAYGDFYEISVMVHDVSWVYGDHARVCVHDRTTMVQLHDSGAIPIGRDEYLPIRVTGQMFNRDLHLKISLVDDNVWPLADDCEDYIDITIPLGTITEPPKPKPPISDDDIMIYLIAAVIIGLIIYFVRK